MIDFIPFKGSFFNDNFFRPENLVPASVDFSNDDTLNKLRSENHQAIHLVYPENLNQTDNTLQQWYNKGILKKHNNSCYYSLRQEYKLPGESKKLVKEGVVGLIKIMPDRNDLLVHENTIESEVDQLCDYFHSTNIQSSVATGFYKKNSTQVNDIIRESLENPLNQIEDSEGKISIAAIQNPENIETIQKSLSSVKVYLADGHHRNAALKKLAKRGKPVYILIMLINELNSDITVLPIHRSFQDLKISKESLLKKIREDFYVSELDEKARQLPEKKTFHLALKNNLYKLTLKPKKESEITWRFPDAIKDLDHTIIHYFLFEKYLGIKGVEQKKSVNIKFCYIFTNCIDKAKEGLSDLVVILGKVDLKVIKEIAESGYTLPQKSTYFYPKLPSGILFATVKNN